MGIIVEVSSLFAIYATSGNGNRTVFGRGVLVSRRSCSAKEEQGRQEFWKIKFYYWVKNKTGSILRFDSVRSSYVQVLDFVMIISLKH